MADIIVVESQPVIQVIETAAPAPVQIIEALIPGPPGGKGPVGESVTVFTHDYALFVTEGQQPYCFPYAATIRGVSAYLKTVADADVVIDVNVNGVSIFADPNDRPRILAGEHFLSEIALNIPIVRMDLLSIDLDDVGSTLSGEDLSVYVRHEQTV
jgi:hypothetical protein